MFLLHYKKSKAVITLGVYVRDICWWYSSYLACISLQRTWPYI